MKPRKTSRYIYASFVMGLMLLQSARAEDIKDASPSPVAASAQVEIKGELKATCSLTAPSSVELDEIPISALEKKGDRKGLDDYAKTFKITTSCSGTEKYELEFEADNVTTDGCLEASSRAMAFCLYRKDKLINLSDDASRKLEGNTSTEGEMMKVLPARGGGKPVAGEHSGSATVTIKPL